MKIKALSQRQRDVLAWIAAGCPDGVMTGNGHKVTAVALRDRGLVSVSPRGGRWTAAVTDTGRELLAAVPTVARKEPTPAERLITSVLEAGGSLRLRGPDQTGGWYEYNQLVNAANRSRSLPEGKRLALYHDDAEMDLVLEGDPFAGQALPDIPVPAQVRKYHPAVVRYRADGDHQEVSRSSLTRACYILQALALACDARGYRFEYEPDKSFRYVSELRRSLTKGQFQVAVRSHRYRLRITEKWGKTDKHLTSYSPGWDKLPAWQQVRYQPFEPTNILRIENVSGWKNIFGDAKVPLEERLPRLLRHLELDAWQADCTAEHTARADERRKRQWEQAVEQAKTRYDVAYRLKELERQADAWVRAEKLRRYLEAFEAAVEATADPGDRQAATQWLEWSQVNVELNDPLLQRPRLPEAPDPTPEQLQPYLPGWSAHGPRRNTRHPW